MFHLAPGAASSEPGHRQFPCGAWKSLRLKASQMLRGPQMPPQKHISSRAPCCGLGSKVSPENQTNHHRSRASLERGPLLAMTSAQRLRRLRGSLRGNLKFITPRVPAEGPQGLFPSPHPRGLSLLAANLPTHTCLPVQWFRLRLARKAKKGFAFST